MAFAEEIFPDASADDARTICDSFVFDCDEYPGVAHPLRDELLEPLAARLTEVSEHFDRAAEPGNRGSLKILEDRCCVTEPIPTSNIGEATLDGD